MATNKPTCSIPECENQVKARGYCNAHWLRWSRHGDPLLGGKLRKPGRSYSERFFAMTREVDSGCIEWVGSISPQGYGQFQSGDGSSLAHRIAYELAFGKIPETLVIDHLCRNRACVNVEHLELVTQRVNILRGIGESAKNVVKTHCKNGHEFTSANTYITVRGSRLCRICRRNYLNEYRRKYGRKS